MSGKAALEAVLPELGEPRVAGVGAELQLQEVIIKGGHVRRLQLDGDAAHRLGFESLHHLHPVCPAVTAERSRRRLNHRTGSDPESQARVVDVDPWRSWIRI